MVRLEVERDNSLSFQGKPISAQPVDCPVVFKVDTMAAYDIDKAAVEAVTTTLAPNHNLRPQEADAFVVSRDLDIKAFHGFCFVAVQYYKIQK